MSAAVSESSQIEVHLERVLACATSLARTHVGGITALVMVGALGVYHLEEYPRTWLDEGVFMIAAKTLAQTGQYGTQSVDGIHAFDSMVTTGPTMIAPAALMFKLFGAGVLQGRVVAVAYLLLATAGLYCLTAKLHGRSAAVFSVLAFASLTEAGPFANGRHMLGEIAALAFVFWGGVAFVVARAGGWNASLFVAGILLGLAVLTKNQFSILVPVVLIVWLLGRSHGESAPWSQFIVLVGGIVIPTGLWFLYQGVALGPAGFAELVRGMVGQAGVSGIVGPFKRSLYALHFLFASGSATLILAGLVYAWVCDLRDGSIWRPERTLITALGVACLCAYVVVTMEWPRYAMAGVVAASPCAGRLVRDSWKQVAGAARAATGQWRVGVLAHEPLALGVVVVMLTSIVGGLYVNAWEIAQPADESPQQFARLLDTSTEKEATVETLEWEISFLSQRAFHRPPVQVVVEGVKVMTFKDLAAALRWYRAPESAQYLAVGPYAKAFDAYRPDLESGAFARVGSVGDYDLYRRQSSG